MDNASKARLQLVVAAVSTAVTLVSAAALIGGRMRLVDVLLVFSGGFAAGAAFVAAVRTWRDGRGS